MSWFYFYARHVETQDKLAIHLVGDPPSAQRGLRRYSTWLGVLVNHCLAAPMLFVYCLLKGIWVLFRLCNKAAIVLWRDLGMWTSLVSLVSDVDRSGWGLNREYTGQARPKRWQWLWWKEVWWTRRTGMYFLGQAWSIGVDVGVGKGRFMQLNPGERCARIWLGEQVGCSKGGACGSQSSYKYPWCRFLCSCNFLTPLGKY